MKYGFNLLLWTTFVQPEDAARLERIKTLGYDGAEIPAGDGPVAHYRTVRGMLDAAGLEATAIAMATPEADPTSTDAAVREAALDRIKSRIECAALLSSPVLGGPLYAAHKQFRDVPPGEEDVKRAADVLAAGAEFAEQANVILCLEPLNRFEVQLVNTTTEAMQIVDRVNHPNLAVHYDTHHAHIEEQSHRDAIAACGSKLRHLHFSESHRGTLGTGLVDWAAVQDGLRAANYDGWCTVEAFGTQVDGLRQAANVHRNCFNSRDEVLERALPFMREHS